MRAIRAGHVRLLLPADKSVSLRAVTRSFAGGVNLLRRLTEGDVADDEPEPNNEQAAITFAANACFSTGGRDEPPRRNSSRPTPASTSSSC
jgi:hypothetical protein